MSAALNGLFFFFAILLFSIFPGLSCPAKLAGDGAEAERPLCGMQRSGELTHSVAHPKGATARGGAAERKRS